MGRCDVRARAATGGVAGVLAAALVAACTSRSAGGRAHPVEQPGTAADAAFAARLDAEVDQVASWLAAQAVPSEAGLAWPAIPAAPRDDAAVAPAPPADLYSGSAGVVLFFAELAARRAATQPAAAARWRELARRGAAELVARLPARSEKGFDCGLYTGLAGTGAVLLETARLLDEPAWRDAAHACVAALQRAARVAGHGVEWSETTDVIAGGAGIGLFLLAMHEQAGDPLALDLASRAGRRLEQLAVREPVGRSWRMDPSFPRVMPNFSHGTAGIAFFLARLAQASGEARFLDAARDGADHLLAIADRAGGGLRVHHHEPGGRDLHYLGWCHGPTGTARLFEQLAAQTGDARYAEAARATTRTLLASGLPAPQPGFWNNVGQCCGSAGIVERLLDAACDAARAGAGGPAQACRGLARTLAEDLLARGARDAAGLAFPHAEHRTRPEQIAAQCGYMQGAAGVGLALLHLAADARRTSDDASDELAARLPDAVGAHRAIPALQTR